MSYVEFFSVSSIPDNSDPRERIIAIARYYCSAFHAARKVRKYTVHTIVAFITASVCIANRRVALYCHANLLAWYVYTVCSKLYRKWITFPKCFTFSTQCTNKCMHNDYYMVCFLQGAVAKKPYNPILGETFRCYWDLPGGRRNAPDDDSKVHHPHVHLSPPLSPTSPSQFYYDI